MQDSYIHDNSDNIDNENKVWVRQSIHLGKQ